jgi:ribonuclease-3
VTAATVQDVGAGATLRRPPVSSVSKKKKKTKTKEAEAAAELHPARAKELAALARRLGHRFKDLRLLDRALCHSSTGNERRDNYERAEFLGDAVLGFLVADHLFRREPEIPVGQLTDHRARVVSRPPLAKIAAELGLGALLVGGRGLREQDRASKRILADLVEAVLGAIYLDGGVRAARKFVRAHILGRMPAETGARKAYRDPKSRLLHFAQVNQRGQPTYRVLDAHGPDHERIFRVTVELQGEMLGTGQGSTKQAAEMMAARAALEHLQDEDQLEA